jgi:hypothetical protein
LKKKERFIVSLLNSEKSAAICPSSKYLAGIVAVVHSDTGLKLRLDFEFTEPSMSKEWLLGALKSRKEIGFMDDMLSGKERGPMCILTSH